MKKITTRLYTRIVIAAVSLFSVLTLSTCETVQSVLKEPVLSLHSAELASISFTGAQLLCKVQVENPNAFDIPFPETDWELFINSNSFVSGVIKNDRQIRARSTIIVDVPVDLSYLEIFNAFRSLRGSQKAAYKVALAMKFSIPVFGDKVWNFQHEGEIPFPQLPRLTSPSLRLENASLTGAEIVFTVNVDNPNAFALPSPKIDYDFQLNRASFIKGRVDNSGPIAAYAVTPVSFRMIVNYADLFRNFSALRASPQVQSLLLFRCDFDIPVFSGEALRLEIPWNLPLR
jgi:LEA14-like dessication related protein